MMIASFYRSDHTGDQMKCISSTKSECQYSIKGNKILSFEKAKNRIPAIRQRYMSPYQIFSMPTVIVDGVSGKLTPSV